ncbi:MAG: PAS domain S-box protein, partial [Syntrophobacterales bacterium]|nr:PAS domain S-box protein [Syntrophobacterales bacterium]
MIPSIGNKRIIPIWLATVIVILMVILFSMLINRAREKEIVERFSRQQMTIARGVAAGVEDFISDVEKSMTIHSLRRAIGREASTPLREDIRVIFDSLGAKVKFVAAEGAHRMPIVYPSDYQQAFLAKMPEMQTLMRKVKTTEKPHVGDFLMRKEGSDGVERTGGDDILVVVAVPRFGQDSEVIGAFYAALSLSTVVDRYIRPAKDELSCEVWVVDDKGMIAFHTNGYLAGRKADIIEAEQPSGGLSLKSNMLTGGEGIGEYRVLRGQGRDEMQIVAFSPIELESRKWSVAVGLPYQAAVSHLKKTFVILMLEAFVLIVTAIVGAALIFYTSRRRLVLEEELKRFKERDDLQEKLAREKRTMEGIIEGSPIPTFVIDREHKVIFWNRACEELTGCRSVEMIGTDKQYMPFYSEKRPVIADLIVDNDFDGLDKYYGKKQVQKSSVVEKAYEARDFYENLGGRRRHLYFLAAPIYDENGQIIAAIETLQDVTREREMELALKEYAETLKNELYENIKLKKDIEELYNYLQLILESSPDRIFDVTSDGTVNFVSRSLDSGKGAKQLQGKHFTEFVAPEHKEFLIKRWKEIKGGQYHPFEIEATARDGTKRNLLITPRPIKGTDRYLFVQRDITEFKDLEKKFYDSQKLAAVGQLSAGIAHEVRNPLSSIKMSLQILQKRLRPEGNDLKRFKIAEKEVEHLEKIVSDILLFAKPMEPDMRPGDIN